MKRSSILAMMSAAALILAACGSSSDSPETPAESSSSSTASPDGDADSATDGDSAEPTESTADDATPVEGGTFTMVLSGDPGNLDPQMTSLSGAYQVDRFLYDSLVSVATDGSMVPFLAESWDGDSTSATFTLRDGITCADGTALTASMVADNINFVGNPDNASSRIGIFVQPGATATADDATRTVTVSSPSPDAFLTRNLGQLEIICPAGMADRGLLAQGSSGTGLFTITEAVPNDHYTLTRRTDYTWGPGDYDPAAAGQPDTVVFSVVENETTATNLLLAGEVNAAGIVGPDRDRIVEAGLFQKDMPASLGEMWFNHDAGHATADEATRVALVQALDLSQLAAVVGGGAGATPTGLVPNGPCTADSWAGHVPQYDPAAAGAVLSGQSLNVVLYYPSGLGPTMQAGAELMQAMWAEAGVTAELKPMTDTDTSAILFGGQAPWDIVIVPLNVDLPTQLVPFLSGATPPDGTNFGFIDNKDYVSHTTAAQQQAGDSGCADWIAAESAIFEAADMVPFVDTVRSVFATGATFELVQGSVDPATIRMVS